MNPMKEMIEKMRCPSCGAVIQMGITTKFDERKNSEVCKACRAVVGERI